MTARAEERPDLGPSWRWVARLASGAAVLTAAAWLLRSTILGLLESGAIHDVDAHMAAWLHTAATPALTDFLLWVSWIHGIVGILTLTAIAAIAAWRYSNRWPAAALLVTVPSGLLLNVAVKHAVQRPRPHWGYALQALETYSFPSGHIVGATLFYGIVVAWLWPRVSSVGARAAMLMAAALLVLVVATSRIVVGVHFLSDCVAAVIEAGVWLAICLTTPRGPVAFPSQPPAQP